MIRQTSHCRRRGFTLLELMISIALVLLLVLGINQVFSLTGRTVGAGQAISGIQRDFRAAQSTIYEDLNNAVVNDGPFLFIRSEREWGWRNFDDQNNDRDANYRTQDIDGDESEGNSTGETIAPWMTNSRNHRTDRLGFFARGVFRRQTGNDGTFASDMTSNEAYIWYGHLKRPDNTYQLNSYQLPGSGDVSTNPNNWYATDWVLGRVCLLLREPVGGVIKDRNNVDQIHIRKSQNPAALAPLTENSQAADSNRVQWNRYDLAGTSIDGFKTILNNNVTNANWFGGLSVYRFQGNPKPFKPLTSTGVSQVAPCFLPGCTQFIVEYAGDFLTQNKDSGQVMTPANPVEPGSPFGGDGVTDFVVLNTTTGIRGVRWYGFPRDANDDGVIDATNDVVTLKEVTGGVQALFERGTPPSSKSLAENSSYIAAWGSDTRAKGLPTPTMLRLTFSLDDKNNRIGAAQTYECVVKVR